MPILNEDVNNFHDKRNSIILLNDLTASGWYSYNRARDEIAFIDSSVLEAGQVIQSIDVTIRTFGGGTLAGSGTGATPIIIDTTGYPDAKPWRIDYKVTTTDGKSNSAPGFFFDPLDDDETSGNVNPNCPALRDKTILEDTGIIPISGGIVFQGGYDANANVPDLVTPPTGFVQQGFEWVVDTAGSLFYGVVLEKGDVLTSRVDNPSSLNDWVIVQANITSLDDVPDGSTYIRVLKTKYVSDYFVSDDFGDDTNDGLNEERPFKTLGAALDAITTAGVAAAIHLMDDSDYIVTETSGTPGVRTTAVDLIIIGNGSKLVGQAGGVDWLINNSRFDGMDVDGTNLRIRNNVTSGEHHHTWKKIEEPNTLYYTDPSDPIRARFTFYAGRIRGAGEVCNIQREAKIYAYMGDTIVTFNSGSTEAAFVASGSNTRVEYTALNMDVPNSGAGLGANIKLSSGAVGFTSVGCSASPLGGDVGAGSKLHTISSFTGGGPMTYTGAGEINDTSLREGFNFDNLDNNTGLLGTDTVNVRDLSGTKQVKATITEIGTTIGSLPPSGAAGGDLTGTYPNPNIALDVVDNTNLANMPANTIKGNNTGGAADPIDLTVAQVKTMIGFTSRAVVSKVFGDSPYTTAAEEVVLCDATAGNIVVNLPAAASNANAKIRVKKVDGSVNTVTVDGNGAETIDGQLTSVLAVQWESMTLICDGSNWFEV